MRGAIVGPIVIVIAPATRPQQGVESSYLYLCNSNSEHHYSLITKRTRDRVTQCQWLTDNIAAHTSSFTWSLSKYTLCECNGKYNCELYYLLGICAFCVLPFVRSSLVAPLHPRCLRCRSVIKWRHHISYRRLPRRVSALRIHAALTHQLRLPCTTHLCGIVWNTPSPTFTNTLVSRSSL